MSSELESDLARLQDLVKQHGPILEDLYDDRATVEGILRAKGKLPLAAPPPGP